jgi:hypothetical protein
MNGCFCQAYSQVKIRGSAAPDQRSRSHRTCRGARRTAFRGWPRGDNRERARRHCAAPVRQSNGSEAAATDSAHPHVVMTSPRDHYTLPACDRLRSATSVKGVRDIASGLMAVILLAARYPRPGLVRAGASTIPIGDAIIVPRSKRPESHRLRRAWRDGRSVAGHRRAPIHLTS